ncbi:MAG: response regulator receiver protein [Phycisphaerales bacterium]|nr:response regulator receiver protein [Phycisphaerales bacterium]
MTNRPDNAADVLVVDDHVDTCRLLALVLNRAGYAVSTASNFDAAMELMRGVRFDVVIVDVGLPGRDGCDLLAAAAELYSFRGIVLSGSDPEIYRDRCRGLPDLQLMRKPIDVDRLLAAVTLASRGAAGPGASLPSQLFHGTPPCTGHFCSTSI